MEEIHRFHQKVFSFKWELLIHVHHLLFQGETIWVDIGTFFDLFDTILFFRTKPYYFLSSSYIITYLLKTSLFGHLLFHILCFAQVYFIKLSYLWNKIRKIWDFLLILFYSSTGVTRISFSFRAHNLVKWCT